MKNNLVILAFLITFVSPFSSVSQVANNMNVFLAKKQPLFTFSSGSTITRTDSVNLNVFIHITALTDSIHELYLGVGPTQNSTTLLNDTIKIILINNQYIIKYNNLSEQLPYNNNTVLKYKMPLISSLKWATIEFKLNNNQLAAKKHTVIK